MNKLRKLTLSLMSNREGLSLKLVCVLLVLYLFSSSTIVLSAELKKKLQDVGEYSHKLYEDRDETRVICGDFGVIAFSDYKVQGKLPDKQLQNIIRQYFEFTDLKNGNKKIVVATTMDMLIGSDESTKESLLEDSYLNGQAI